MSNAGPPPLPVPEKRAFGTDLGKLLEALLVPGLAFLPVLHDLGGQLAHVFNEAFTLTLETLLHLLALFAGTLLARP